MKRDLRFEMIYPHSPERVWRALTSREELAQWLMPNDFEPRIGHKFHLLGKPRPGFDGRLQCEVIEMEEHRRFAYRWLGGTLDTVVRILLEPAEQGGTKLVLEHNGFEGVGGVMISALMAWNRMLREELPAVLAGNTVPTTPGSSASKIASLIDRYERGAAVLADFVANVPAELMNIAPAGEWSVHQTALHIVDAEIVGAWRLRMMAAQPGGKLASYRGDVWARELVYPQQPLPPALELFHSLRKVTTSMLRRLPTAAWANRAEQEEEGEVTLESCLLSHCEHADGHMAEMELLLEKLASETVSLGNEP